MANKKFSKDPKCSVITVEEFFENADYFTEYEKLNLWNGKSKPSLCTSYYKFTHDLFIYICYGSTTCDFGMKWKEHLEQIIVSYRDGKTEYDLIKRKIIELESKKNDKSNLNNIKKINKQIYSLEKFKNSLPNYFISSNSLYQPFENYIIDTGYKTNIEDLKNKYIVLDVETNGIRKSNDDLLSLSIYDPTSGLCYNRYLPLDLQPLVLTTYINGITDELLSNYVHLSQEEIDWIYQYFNLKEKIILSYSGGKGSFDISFVQNYIKWKKLIGFDDLKIENIKSKLPNAPFGSEGELTKDNLCRIFSIDGVVDVHSGLNDCVLEWKLYEYLSTGCYFFIENHLYQYSSNFIIPYTYLYKHPELIKFANVTFPALRGSVEEVYKLSFPKRALNEIKKFPTNITGITIEHAINSYLKAEKQDNIEFLIKNKSYLKFIGSLDSKLNKIPIVTEDDGTIKTLKPEYQVFINDVNSVTKSIMKLIKPLADYIKNNIFQSGKIMTQELSISNDRKVLALCDLSDNKNIIEIKTNNVFSEDGHLSPGIARQLYFQANGRTPYLLNLNFLSHKFKDVGKAILDRLDVVLYKVVLVNVDKS